MDSQSSADSAFGAVRFLQPHNKLDPLTLVIVGPVCTVLFVLFIAWGHPSGYEFQACVLYFTIKIKGILT